MQPMPTFWEMKNISMLYWMPLKKTMNLASIISHYPDLF